LQQVVKALTKELLEPGLVIIEAPTGEGKTEAALYLVDWWNKQFDQRGAYFALPTQATSNQMFGRVRNFLAASYTGDEVDLQLIHGHAALSAEFEVLRRHGDRLLEPGGIGVREGGDEEVRSNVVAGEWFTHRKRGLLSAFGVGTIDQALLAALKARHVFVRLFGLSSKTVVVDEVHAYDTYMTTLLERLLEWLAALGTSVVMLSATLPQARRQGLLEAYRRGAGWPAADAPPASPYPRVSWATARGTGEKHVQASPLARKTVEVEWLDMRLPATLDGPPELALRLQHALKGGGCAAVICNTVRRAQEVYQALKLHFPGRAEDGFPELGLLHSRYPFEERDQRERLARLRFGKHSEEVRRPSRAVLVATQIIEQSLDLDFDLLVAELAPVDLVLQRAGRLHRHERSRPRRLQSPTLLLSAVEVDVKGVPHFEPGSEHVYDSHVLLRSWLALRDRSAIRVPEDVEALIEEVYGERTCPDTLSGHLRELWNGTFKKQHNAMEADRYKAQDRWLRPPWSDEALWQFTDNALEEDRPEFHEEHQALTRLADPTVDVVLLYGTQERPCLDSALTQPVDAKAPPTVPQAKQLLRRSVPVSDRRVVYTLLDQPVPSGWCSSPLLRHHRLLVLDADGSALVGRWRLELDDDLGLVIRDGEGGQ
jgi:CRISPR-associated endonuclease/helicase Cas3